jgi:hypothetical protein
MSKKKKKKKREKKPAPPPPEPKLEDMPVKWQFLLVITLAPLFLLWLMLGGGNFKCEG